jgi:hypothetical protein
VIACPHRVQQRSIDIEKVQRWHNSSKRRFLRAEPVLMQGQKVSTWPLAKLLSFPQVALLSLQPRKRSNVHAHPYSNLSVVLFFKPKLYNAKTNRPGKFANDITEKI